MTTTPASPIDDLSPQHVDPEFAASTRFQGVFAHGMWGGALISGVFGTLLPGPGFVYFGQTLRLLKPVRLRDTSRVNVAVSALDAKRKLVTLDCFLMQTVFYLCPFIITDAIINILPGSAAGASGLETDPIPASPSGAIGRSTERGVPQARWHWLGLGRRRVRRSCGPCRAAGDPRNDPFPSRSCIG